MINHIMGVPAHNLFCGSHKVKQSKNWSRPSQSGKAYLGTALQNNEKSTGIIYHMQKHKTDARLPYSLLSSAMLLVSTFPLSWKAFYLISLISKHFLNSEKAQSITNRKFLYLIRCKRIFEVG